MEPSPKEKKLLDASKSFDKAIQDCDRSAVDALFAAEVTIHKDDLTLFEDLHGAKAASDWVASYWQRRMCNLSCVTDIAQQKPLCCMYEYQHVPIVGAVNEVCPMGFPGGMTFSFWEDKGVKLNDPSLAPESPEEARRPCTTAGIWHFMYDVDLKIADVWFLRELSTDEFHRKMKKPPPQALVYDPESFRGSPPGVTPSAGRRLKMLELMATYDEIWATSDASIADQCLAPDVELDQAIVGHVHKGIQAVKDLITNYFAKNWEVKEQHNCLAATAGSKAFNFWHTRAIDRNTNKEVWMYGLRLVAFNADVNIQRILGFRQLTPKEVEQLVKPEVRETK